MKWYEFSCETNATVNGQKYTHALHIQSAHEHIYAIPTVNSNDYRIK